MSNAISRRTFLRCAGAATVAVGAASMLGGCSNPYDSLLEWLAEQSQSENAQRVGKAVVFVEDALGHKIEKENEEAFARPDFDAVNVYAKVSILSGSADVSVKLKINGKDAARLTGKEALAKRGRSDTIGNIDGNLQVSGSLAEKYGVLVFAVPESEIETWTTAEVTFTNEGETAAFIITRDMQTGTMSCKKK